MTPYQIKRQKDLETIKQLSCEVVKHPNIDNIILFVNRNMNGYYESASILMISKDRFDFDQYYDLEYIYRGGFVETKLGENYILYGFNYD